MQNIGVLIESDQGIIKKTNLGPVAAARGTDHQLFAMLLADCSDACRQELQAHGVHHLIDVRIDPDPGIWHPEMAAGAIIQAMKHFQLNTLMGLSSLRGGDLLARIAAALDAPLVLDCIAVDLAASRVVKSQFSGKTTATLALQGNPRIIGLRPNAVASSKAPVEARADTFTATVAPGRLKVREIKTQAAAGVDLTEAEIIISGGRAMGAAENFNLLRECAQTMGAAVGASRAAVDAGFAPHAMQVGQTGKTVSPKVYIACGISGAVQHFAGMKTSQMIVAINTDPDAYMMKNSDYALAGDLFDIVPRLTQRLKSRETA